MNIANTRSDPKTLLYSAVPEAAATTLAALLAEQFAKTPAAPALTLGDTTLTYAELDTRTGALAEMLQARGVGPGSTVAIALPRSFDLVIALLAVIRAGGAYVPLNLDDPETRRTDILNECQPVLLLAEAACGPTPLLAPSDWPHTGTCPAPVLLAPQDLAYVLYTSGSTGKPKGVLIEQDAVINSVMWLSDQFGLGADDRVLHKSPLSFDISVWEIFGALLSGSELVLAPEGAHRDPREILSLIRAHDITLVHFVPTMLNLFLDVMDAGPRLKIARVLTGGEALLPVQRARFHRLIDAELHNTYGPTETTVTVAHWPAGPEDLSDPLPIGHPIANTRLYVLDEAHQKLAPGEKGRLWIAGRNLARGYLKRDELTAERFLEDPFVPGERMYDSGDLAELREDGAVIYHGRADTQIKIRGIRLELGEVEAALEAEPAIDQAVVVARDDLGGGELRLAAFCLGDPFDEATLRQTLAQTLPAHAVPARIQRLEAFPFNTVGKVDRRALTKRKIDTPAKIKTTSAPNSKGSGTMARQIVGTLADILGLEAAGIDRGANFFDLGASSLHLVQLREGLRETLGREFPVSDLFLYSTVDALAAHLSGEETGPKEPISPERETKTDLIAIVGMAGRFPGAPSVEAFWQGMLDGRDMISHFTEDELDFDPRKTNPGTDYVLSRGVLEDPALFDAKHFGIPPREAERLDPQHRIMLELAQTALEDAGHDPDRFGGKIGVFCGASQSSYLLNNLLGAPGAARELAASYPVRDFATTLGNDKDFLATRLAYKLNLKGPAMTVQTACSTALTAVAQACSALRTGQADMVLAGAVSVTFPTKRPYAYLPEGMASANGQCRTFDAGASGTVFGDGAGIVVLRRLEDALADGDDVIAVIRGVGINNDGGEKAGYAAPSIRAQADAIRSAHLAAGIAPREVGYIEAHGTATPLGDPIEFTALQTVFGEGTGDRQFCALGTAKTNIGHLDIAAGAAGLIKAALVLKHGKIPPLLHFTAPNPQIDFESSAFYPVQHLTEWARGETARIAGVSAFGVGGTNVHMVLEEAPESPEIETSVIETPRVFPISGTTPEAVADQIAALEEFAVENPDADPDRVVATLRHGRRQFAERTVLVARDMAELATVAAAHKGAAVKSGTRAQLAFLFPGQGAQHVGMAQHLYEAAPVFRDAFSDCTDLLTPELGLDLRNVIHAPADQAEAMTERLKDTALAQPAIFATSYALAKQWAHWGVAPDAMIGHSIGEFVAATLAGVMDLPDALRLIALRGRLMADLPRGAMVSVRASEDEVMPYLQAGLDLAAVNGAKAVVLAGPEEAADAILPQIEADGFVAARLHTSHAFHSHMMEPALAPFHKAVAALTLAAPHTPILSTVTGDWLTDDEATSPEYWAGHMRRPVRFYDAVQTLWAEGQHMFLESGPGRTLSTLAGQNPDRARRMPALASLPHAQAENPNSHIAMLDSFGQLWAHGYPVDWQRIDDGRPEAPRLSGLPTYPFQRKKFWIEPVEHRPGEAPHEPENDEALDESAPLPPADAGAAVREMLSDLSGVEPSDMDGSATFLELGFDSLLLTQATREISDRFGTTVTLRQLIDGFPNIDALAAHIEANGNLSGTAPADKTKIGWMAEMERPEPASKPAQSSAPVTTITREAEEISPDQRAHIDRIVQRFVAKTPKSKALTQEYRPYHADPRTAAGFNRLWKEGVYQVVSDRSKGSRLIDVDGNEYVDLLNGFGPGFFGHTNDMITEAVAERLTRGFEVGPQHIEAMEASKLFCEVTGNERASFVCTGSEAVYAAMRLARTVTNRDKIVIFQRDYHGNFDEVLVRGLEGVNGPRTLPLTPGIPADSVKNIVVLPYGTSQSLDWIRAHADQLAAVVIEPVQSRRPEFRPVEFVRDIRRITENSGALMVFDEVVTGFRFGPRGAQAYYGIEADLVTYGKIVGGEMPVGVVAGKARFMDTFDGGQWAYGDDSFPEAPVTFFAGTFVRHPLAMAAVKAVLTYLKAQPALFWHGISAKGDRLAGTMHRWFEDNDMPFELPNCGSLMYLRIGEDQKFGGLMGLHMRARGVFLLEGFPSYLTAAHDDEDISFAIDAYKDAALEMRAGGLLTGREATPYEGPHISAAPPRLSLPDGAQKIAAQMARPVQPLKVPTTAAQQEIWTALQFTPDLNLAYNESVRLDLHGPIDADKMRAAMGMVVARHDALRSTFTADGTQMIIHPDLEIEMGVTDLSSDAAGEDKLNTLLRREVEVELDLANGPLVRAELVHLRDDHHVLIITAHHIVCDGWSIDVVSRDLGTLYGALVAGTRPNLEPVQSIIDYTSVETAWQQTDEAAQTRAFWRAQYQDNVPEIDVPTDHARSADTALTGARLDVPLPSDLTERLRAMARRENVSFVTLLFAAWSLQMARLARTDDMVIGLPTAGQSARGMPGVVGHCVHFLPIRTAVPADLSLKDYLAATRHTLLDAFDHQTFTLGEVVRDLNMRRQEGRVTLTPLAFNYDMGIDLSQMSFGAASSGLETNPRVVETFEIFVNLTDKGDFLLTEWSYKTALFDEATIARHAAGFIALLEAFTRAETSQNLAQLSVLSDSDQAVIKAACGHSTDSPTDTAVADLFRQVAASAGARPALIDAEGTPVSYAELETSSDIWARHLVASGVRPGDFVAVSLARAPRLITALLAILKAGATYVPLETSFPAQRVTFILEDCQARHVITDPERDMDLPGGVQRIDMGHILPQTHDEALPTLAGGAAPVYLMYTSGSTGTPKGVLVPQQGITRLVLGTDYAHFDDSRVFLQLAPVGFDAATFEIWGALLNGAKLVVPAPNIGTDPARLKQALQTHNVTTLWLTAALFNTIIDMDPGVLNGVDEILTGGEALSVPHIRKAMEALPGTQLINGYGPTENTTFSCTWAITELPDEGTPIPIGRPIANSRAYIVDHMLQPVPPGVTGELVVAGDGLALGYLGRDELTEKAFVPAPALEEARVYRTGDLCRLRSDGVFLYQGRADHQIKLRGFRIELGEIEAAMVALPNVGQAATLVMGHGNEAKLAGFVTPDADQGPLPTPQDIRAALAETLPDYMVPGHIQVLDRLPMNVSGKIDRQALPGLFDADAPAEDGTPGTNGVPQTDTEEKMIAIWQEFFPERHVGMEDNFFEIGGHSLMALTLFDRIRREMEYDLPIGALLRHQTPRALLGALDTAEPATARKTTRTVGDRDDWDTTMVIDPGPEDQTRRPVFIVGGVGGNVNNLYELGQNLGKTRPVIGFQTRGVMGHKPHSSIEAMADENIHYMRQHQKEGPYILAGYSGGAYTALEMARQLEERGEDVQELIVLDTYAPHFLDQFSQNAQSGLRERLSDEMLLLRDHGLGALFARAKAKAYAKILPFITSWKAEKTSLSAARHRVMREVWVAAAQKYKGGSITAPIVLVSIEGNLASRAERAALAFDPTLGWQELTTTGAFQKITLEGDHHNMLTGVRAAQLADELEQGMARKTE